MAMMMIGIDDGTFFLDKIEDFWRRDFYWGKKHLNLLSANKLQILSITFKLILIY